MFKNYERTHVCDTVSKNFKLAINEHFYLAVREHLKLPMNEN